MPVCPGCEREMPHEQLPVHQRFCEALRGSGEHGTAAPQQLEQYLSDLDKRLQEQREHEDEMDRRLHRLENELRAK